MPRDCAMTASPAAYCACTLPRRLFIFIVARTPESRPLAANDRDAMSASCPPEAWDWA